jgi:hypothetical protein
MRGITYASRLLFLALAVLLLVGPASAVRKNRRNAIFRLSRRQDNASLPTLGTASGGKTCLTGGVCSVTTTLNWTPESAAATGPVPWTIVNQGTTEPILASGTFDRTPESGGLAADFTADFVSDFNG